VDRLQVYLGQVPLETDLLNTNKFAMMGLAKLASAVLGAGPVLQGLPCTPGAGLTVSVGAGQVYQSANVDSTAYSSLPADTAHQVLKQGILLDPVVLSCPAPGTAGQSINYLVEVGFQEVDTGALVLQYYNPSNPAVPFIGPAGAGSSNNMIRAGKCVVQVKAGAAATTGSQTTPAVDAGFIAAYVVTVANGAVSIVTGNIVTAAGAPFLAGLLASHHSGAAGQAPKVSLANEVQGILPIANLPTGMPVWAGTSTGSANAQVLTPATAFASVPTGTSVSWLAGFSNTGAMTISIAGGFGPYGVRKDGPAGPVALTGGESVAGAIMSGIFDGTFVQLTAVSPMVGTAVAGHIAVFADTFGRVQDGGPPGVATISTYINAGTTLGVGSYRVDTSGGAFTVTLPAAPALGATLEFQDVTGTWSTSPLTLSRNGNTILGLASDLVCDVSGELFEIWFNGSDWRLV
jgi:hypothetical protein